MREVPSGQDWRFLNQSSRIRQSFLDRAGECVQGTIASRRARFLIRTHTHVFLGGRTVCTCMYIYIYIALHCIGPQSLQTRPKNHAVNSERRQALLPARLERLYSLRPTAKCREIAPSRPDGAKRKWPQPLGAQQCGSRPHPGPSTAA